MNGFSEACAQNVMAYVFRQTTFTVPVTWFCGLSVTDFSPEPVGIAEPTGIGAYTRTTVNSGGFGVPVTSPGNKTSVTNTADIRFIESTASWGIISAFLMLVLNDDPEVNNAALWFGGQLDVAKQIEGQTVAVFAPGDMVIATINEGL